jgi:hypothetical protein
MMVVTAAASSGFHATGGVSAGPATTAGGSNEGPAIAGDGVAAGSATTAGDAAAGSATTAGGSNGGSASVGVLTGRVSVAAAMGGVDLGRRVLGAFVQQSPGFWSCWSLSLESCCVQDFRISPKPLIGLLAAACALAAPSPAQAFSPFLVVPEPAVAEASPAYRYANMTDSEAIAELDRRSILYSRLDAVPGVRAPIRITGRLHGVYVHSSLPPDQRVTSIFEILDARLALALDDFCALLERHDIDEIVHFTMYRPNVAAPDHGPPDETPQAASRTLGARPRPIAQATMTHALTPGSAPGSKTKPAPSLGPKGALEAKTPAHADAAAKQKSDDGAAKPEPGVVTGPAAKKAAPKAPTLPAKAAPGRANPAALPPKAAPVAGKRVAKRDPVATGLHQTTWAPPGTRHPAGLAIDVGMLHKRDGRWISVARDFQGKIGARTCGEGAPAPENPIAVELRALVCESAAQGVFTYVLTPDYNAAHADHFHMEIKPGVKWFLYH